MPGHWRITGRSISYLAIFAILLVSAAAVARSTTPSASAQQQKAAGPSTASALTLTRWAFVRQDAKLINSSTGGRASFFSSSNPVIYSVGWGVALSSRCVPVVTSDFHMGPGPIQGSGGFLGVILNSNRVLVKSFVPIRGTVKDAKQPFYIALFCP